MTRISKGRREKLAKNAKNTLIPYVPHPGSRSKYRPHKGRKERPDALTTDRFSAILSEHLQRDTP